MVLTEGEPFATDTFDDALYNTTILSVEANTEVLGNWLTGREFVAVFTIRLEHQQLC